MSQLDTLLARTKQWAAGLDDIVESGAVLTRRTIIATLATIAAMAVITGIVTVFVTSGTVVPSKTIVVVVFFFVVPVSLAAILVVNRFGVPPQKFWYGIAVVVFGMLVFPAYVNGSIASVMYVGVYPTFWVVLPAGVALRFAVASLIGMLVALAITSAPVDTQILVRALTGDVIVITLTHLVFLNLAAIIGGARKLGASVREGLTQLERDLQAAEEARASQERLDAATGLLSAGGLASAFEERVAAAEGEASVLSVKLLRWDETASALELGAQATGEQIIAGRLRQLAGADALVGRVGRAEFVVVWEGGRSDTLGTWPSIRQLFDGLRDPVLIDERAIITAPAVGVARYPADGSTLAECLRRAEIARVVAEQMEVEAPSRFDVGMERRLRDRAIDTERLRDALANESFELWYQPVVPTLGGRPAYAEALIRWRDGERGIVGPGEFLPLLASAGMMPDLTQWALRRAVADVRRIRAAVDPAFRISVNIAPELLAAMNAVAAIRTLESLEAPPESLTMELTEASFIEMNEEVRKVLQAMRARGVKVAVDDFGTGYSSLDRLESLPVDILKIDRAFIRRLDGGASRSAGVLRAVVQLGRVLGLEMVAEGVETEAQRATLAELGCPTIQGYLFSKAVPVDDLIALIERTPAAPVG